MRDHDFDPWFRLLLWVTATTEHRSILKILLRRIRDMYILQGKRKNLKQVFLYLKECYTICVSVKVGSHYDPKVGVRCGKGSGLPLLIPRRLHKLMMTERKVYIAVMTLLGIHRVIPWWPPVDRSTITERFNGTYRTLEVETLEVSKGKLCELAGVKSDIRFVNLKAVTLLPESAGPNHSVAWKGVLEDAFALFSRPKYFWSLQKWFWMTRSYLAFFSLASLFPVWLAYYCLRLTWVKTIWLKVKLLRFCHITQRILIWILIHWRRALVSDYETRRPKWFWANEGASLGDIRLVCVFLWIASRPRFSSMIFSLMVKASSVLSRDVVGLSRLTAVYNTAGKARVIGITNYWVQIALYPLHREIFRFLEGLPTDGTYDQLKPVKTLEEGPTYYSYDLSAATDRLPRDIQRDVMGLFIGLPLSRLWERLVDMPFLVSKDSSEEIHYSVGQPMGAYSSWASLALTHHMIVQTSGRGSEPVRKYAVLGDDVVVSDDVAPRYLELMTGLGVGISLAKSIVSNEFIEFAKRVRTLKGEDYSIIGPGLIMAAVRNRFLSAVALADSIRKDIVRWTAAPKVFLEMPGRTKRFRGKAKELANPGPFSVVRGPLDYGSWVLFGPKGLLSRNLSFALSEGSVRAFQDLKHESFFFKVQMREFLKKETQAKWTNSKEVAANVLNDLRLDLWSITSRCGLGFPTRILLYVALWLTPIPWLIIAKYGVILESVDPWVEKQYHKWYIDDIISDALDGFEELNISALEPLTRREANNILRFWDGLMSYDPDAEKRMAMRAQAASAIRGFRAHGRAVPEYSQDGRKGTHFDINDI
jgi:hypothetical protein